MKKIKALIAVCVCSLFFSSCGDSHDKLMSDQISWMGKITTILNKVADGDLSSSDATAQLNELNEEADKFAERRVKLDADMTADDLLKQVDKYKGELTGTFKEFMAAADKLSKSGRMTQELSDAIENMNPSGN